MTSAFFKTSYYLLQLIVCLLFILERVQPQLLPFPYHQYPRVPSVRPTLPKRPRLLTWRRLLFLLG